MTWPSVDPPSVAVLVGGRPLEIVEHGGTAEAIAWPGTGSHVRAMHRIELAAGGRTIELRHASEAVYFVVDGSGSIGDEPLVRYNMIYVPRRTPYRFEADGRLLLVGGPCPPDNSLYGVGEPLGSGDAPVEPVSIYDATTDGEPLPMIGRRVRLVVWPGTGADIATMNFAILDPGEENQPHSHAESDDVIAILDGRGSIDDLTHGTIHEFEAGDVVFVRAGVAHRVKADKQVAVVSAGGPCPPDYDMLRSLNLVW
jgi:mannose-6-phosphate isomerase-like protein (cupin superfamily)